MAELISLDATSENPANAQFDLHGGGNGIAILEGSIDWDDPDPQILFAGSADTEGDPLVSSRPSNRQPQFTVIVTAATAAALDTACGQLQQKIAKIAREFGTLKRTTSGGNVGTLDLLYARCAPKADWAYVNALTAIIPLRFTALPYWRGPEVGTILDDFSSDSIGAGKYTFDSGAGQLSVSGGQLVPSSTAVKELYRSAEGLTYYDAQATTKVTTGASVASTNDAVMLKRTSSGNYLRCRFTATNIFIGTIIGGVGVDLVSAAFVPSPATSYWLRGRIEGNLVTVEIWTAAPTATGSPAASVTTVLAGTNATLFGLGVAGNVGLRLGPGGTDERFDDFQIDPYTYVEKTNPILVTPPIYGIKGDVPALARYVLNELASLDQWWAIYGNESRYFSKGVPTILDQFGVDTIGSGAWAVDGGAGTLSVSGGLLVPSSTAQKRLHRTDSVVYTDTRSVVKTTTGASVASGLTGAMARWLDDNNFLYARINFAGAASNLTLQKRVAGTDFALGSASANFTTAAATSYWLEHIVQGSKLTVNAYAADPATGAAIIAGATATYTLTAAEAAQFAAGGNGLLLIPQATDYRYDDFRILPLQGCTEALIDSESLLTSGYSGVQTTRAGASSGGTVANHVVRHTLANAYAASCAIPPQGHVGWYRVFARLYRPTTNSGQVSVALEWGTGDLLRVTHNDDAVFAAGERQGDFTITDLGSIQIAPATKGTQQWQGRIVAKSTVLSDVLDVDYLFLVPYAEGSAEVKSVQQMSTPSVLSLRDEFDQTAGNLNAKTLPLGGTWTTSGADVTDITVETAGHTATRATVSDASGKTAVAGTTTFTNLLAQFDFKASIVDATVVAEMRLLARYVDASNYLMGRMLLTGGKAKIDIEKTVAGASSTIVPIQSIAIAAATWYSLRLYVDVNGRVMLAFFAQGATPTAWLLSGSDPVLATGGALASGKIGFYDLHADATACTRNYDNFWAAVPVPDAAIFAGRQAELRYDSAVRQDSAGALWTPESRFEGDFAHLIPAGREGRQNRLVIDTCRNDPATMTDPSLSKTQLQIVHVPRYLSIPAG